MLEVWAKQVGDEDLGRGAHDPIGAVMLGDPEAMIAPCLGFLRQLDGAAQGIGRGFRSVDRTLVEDAEL